MERLSRRFPHTLVLSFEPANGTSEGCVPTLGVTGRSDHLIALDFVEAMRGTPASGAESALFLAACDACSDDPDLDASEVAG